MIDIICCFVSVVDEMIFRYEACVRLAALHLQQVAFDTNCLKDGRVSLTKLEYALCLLKLQCFSSSNMSVMNAYQCILPSEYLCEIYGAV